MHSSDSIVRSKLVELFYSAAADIAKKLKLLGNDFASWWTTFCTISTRRVITLLFYKEQRRALVSVSP